MANYNKFWPPAYKAVPRGQEGREMKAFYRVSEVMEILNIGRTKAYDLIRAGVIPSCEIDGNIRIPAKSLHEWIDHKIAASNPHANQVNGGLMQGNEEPATNTASVRKR